MWLQLDVSLHMAAIKLWQKGFYKQMPKCPCECSVSVQRSMDCAAEYLLVIYIHLASKC